MGANTIVVEEKEEDAFNLKQVTNSDKEIADSHVRPDHYRERRVIRLIVNVNLKDRRKVRAMANRRMNLMFEIVLRQLWESSGEIERCMCSIKDIIKFTVLRC